MKKALRDITSVVFGGCLGCAIASAFVNAETGIGIVLCVAFAAAFVREYLL